MNKIIQNHATKSLILLMPILILFSVPFLAISINSNVKEPFINSSQTIVTNINAIQSQKILLTPASHLYTISSQILQRKKYQRQTDQSKNRSDMHRYFHTSQSCRVVNPLLSVKQIMKQRIVSQSQQIKSYFMTPSFQSINQTQIWILTDLNIQKYVLASQNFVLMSKVAAPQVIRESNSYQFIKLDQIICLTDGNVIYVVGRNYVKQQTQKNINNIQISFWKSIREDSKNKGNEMEYQAVKIIQNKNYLLVLTFFTLDIFRYDSTTYQFTQIFNQHSKEQLKKNLKSKSVFVDTIWQEQNPQQIFILTSDSGIIEINDIRAPNFQIYHHDIGQLGILIAFTKFSDVFEIIFKQSQSSKTMVAQFQLFSQLNQSTQKGVNNNQILLNRFYTRVRDIFDVDYVQGRIIILSDNQFFVYGPGVNRNLLIDKTSNTLHQNPYYGVCWDINYFQVLNNRRDQFSLNLLGIGYQHITLYQFQLPSFSVQCNIQESTRIFIKSTGTCEGVQPSLMTMACQKTQVFQINVKVVDLQNRTALYVTIGVMIFGCWLTLWNCLFVKCISNIKNRIKRAKRLIAQKIQKKNTKYDTVVNTQTNQLNQK